MQNRDKSEQLMLFTRRELKRLGAKEVEGYVAAVYPMAVAMRVLGVSRQRVTVLAGKGKIRRYRLGRNWFYDAEDIWGRTPLTRSAPQPLTLLVGNERARATREGDPRPMPGQRGGSPGRCASVRIIRSVG